MISLFDLLVAMCNPFDNLLIYVDELNTLYSFEEFITDFHILEPEKLKFVYVGFLCVNGDSIQCNANYDQLLECFGEELRKR